MELFHIETYLSKVQLLLILLMHMVDGLSLFLQEKKQFLACKIELRCQRKLEKSQKLLTAIIYVGIFIQFNLF